MTIYVDTSALAKRYVSEIGSTEWESFVHERTEPLVLTPLVVTEFHSALMRRLRMAEFDAHYLERARAVFAADMTAGVWQWHAFPADAFGRASMLIQDPADALVTVDALHLACAVELGCTGLATADGRLARAARRHGLTVHQFPG